MAEKQIAIYDIRNVNDISLYGVPTRSAPFLFNIGDGNLSNVVIQSVTLTVNYACTADGINLSFSCGNDTLSCAMPLTCWHDAGAERNAVQRTYALTGWTNSTFASSACTCSASMSGWPGDGGGALCFFHGSAYITVTYQDVASSLVIPTSCTTGQAFLASFSSDATSLSHTLQVDFGETVEYYLAPGVLSCNVTIPNEYLSHFKQAETGLPEGVIGIATCTLTTNTGAASPPRTQKQIYVRASSNSGPSFSTVTVSPYNALGMSTNLFSALGDNIYQYLGGVTVSTKAQGMYGASVVESRITVLNRDGFSNTWSSATGSSSYSMILNTPVFPTSGNVTISLYAKDTRGVETSQTKTIYVQPYSKPSVSAGEISRLSIDHVPNEAIGEHTDGYGKYAMGTFTYSCTAISGNTCSATLFVTLNGVKTHCSSVFASGVPTMIETDAGLVEFSLQNRTTLTLEVSDKYTTSTFTYYVLPASYIRTVHYSSLGKVYVAYGTTPMHYDDCGTFEVAENMNFYVHGKEIEKYIKSIITKDYINTTLNG